MKDAPGCTASNPRRPSACATARHEVDVTADSAGAMRAGSGSTALRACACMRCAAPPRCRRSRGCLARCARRRYASTSTTCPPSSRRSTCSGVTVPPWVITAPSPATTAPTTPAALCTPWRRPCMSGSSTRHYARPTRRRPTSSTCPLTLRRSSCGPSPSGPTCRTMAARRVRTSADRTRGRSSCWLRYVTCRRTAMMMM